MCNDQSPINLRALQILCILAPQKVFVTKYFTKIFLPQIQNKITKIDNKL